MFVRVIQRERRLSRDPDRLLERQLMLTAEPVPKALPVHVHHGEPQLAGGRLARIVDREDVRVLESRSQLNLAAEALRAEARGQVRVKHLERNRAVVLRVLGQVDGGHAATPQLALQGVLRAECRLELLAHVRRCHRRAAKVRVLEATGAPCKELARLDARSPV